MLPCSDEESVYGWSMCLYAEIKGGLKVDIIHCELKKINNYAVSDEYFVDTCASLEQTLGHYQTKTHYIPTFGPLCILK